MFVRLVKSVPLSQGVRTRMHTLFNPEPMILSNTLSNQRLVCFDLVLAP